MATSPRWFLRRHERPVRPFPLSLPMPLSKPTYHPLTAPQQTNRGLNQSYGVFQAYYERTLLPTHSPSTIAWIGSLQIFLLFFMSIVVSGQIDAGRFQHCFTGGSALLVAATVATSFCTRYWHFVLAQGVATGMGMGLLFGAGVQVLFTYFRRRLGIATGIASAGGAVGGMVFPAVCEALIGKVGFAWTVRVVALIVLVTLIPANLMARERPGRRTAKKKEKKKKKPSIDWSAFTDAPYLLVTAGLFCSFWGVYFGFYFIVTYAQETLHLSASEATNLLILMVSIYTFPPPFPPFPRPPPQPLSLPPKTQTQTNPNTNKIPPKKRTPPTSPAASSRPSSPTPASAP